MKPYFALKITHRSTEVDPAAKEFERFVDEVANQVASSLAVVQCSQAADADTFALTIGPTKLRNLPKGHPFQLLVRPASMPSAKPKVVTWANDPWVTFESVSMLGLTSFFVFEVVSNELEMTRQFVLNIPIANEPANRKEALLRHLLSDRGRVLRFMLLLLSDAGADAFTGLAGDGPGTGTPFGFGTSLNGTSLFESLLKTLDREPERLRHVSEIISDLRQTQEGEDLLPDDLDVIWKPIWAVAESELGHQRKGGKT